MQGPVTHRLEVDRPRKLVILEILTMLDPEDAAWVGEELREAVRSFGDEVGQHVTLYDGSAVPSLPTATIDLLQQTFDNPAVRAIWARKVAFVVKTATARMQVRRLQLVRPDFGLFEDREEAIAWLVAP